MAILIMCIIIFLLWLAYDKYNHVYEVTVTYMDGKFDKYYFQNLKQVRVFIVYFDDVSQFEVTSYDVKHIKREKWMHVG